MVLNIALFYQQWLIYSRPWQHFISDVEAFLIFFFLKMIQYNGYFFLFNCSEWLSLGWGSFFRHFDIITSRCKYLNYYSLLLEVNPFM